MLDRSEHGARQKAVSGSPGMGLGMMVQPHLVKQHVLRNLTTHTTRKTIKGYKDSKLYCASWYVLNISGLERWSR
jgi:hypothetical protein